MKTKCPDCGNTDNVEISIEELKEYQKNGNPLMFICNECNEEYNVQENIVYKLPTGGTGEVDPNKTIIPEISLRDYFAGQYLAGIMANPNIDTKEINTMSKLAEKCYKSSDSMLKERDK